MSSWRDEILKEFTPQVARLTLVADPDGLLLEEGILQGIREKGFELIPFEDHVAFRFAYETKYRSHWDRDEMTDLVVVLRSDSHDLRSLPYDLWQNGRKLSFNLGDLFPNLSYPVVDALDRADLDSLYRAQMQYHPGQLGDNATKDFALRHVFEIAPELIKQSSDLLRVLLRRHHRGLRVPPILDERFIQVLHQDKRFADWPLMQIVPDRTAFFAFLQERWPVFLDRLVGPEKPTIHDAAAAYPLKYSGPADIPLDHDDVRVYIDNLFLEGMLRPVSHTKTEVLASQWVAVGLQIDPSADRQRRLVGLVESLESSLPTAEARHQEWLVFAQRWAELLVLLPETSTLDQPEVGKRIGEVRSKVDESFLAWVKSRYAGLHNQPPIPPVMLHHIPRALARRVENAASRKVAMVLIDGLALDQWILIREAIAAQSPDLVLREAEVFAWLPTITSVSRQAAFAGKPPVYFPGSIFTTEKEGTLWSQFWIDKGLTQVEVAYVKGLGEEANFPLVDEAISHPRVRVVGLVVDKVDKIMHGMELGTAGMHNQVRQWAGLGFLTKLLDLLLDRGFDVFLTADHGNIEAEGYGRPAEGVIADLRAERVRVFPDQVLRAKVKQSFPDAIEWPPIGLPEDFLALIAPDRQAFVLKDKRIVSHGGLSIEELVVPLVQIERRTE